MAITRLQFITILEEARLDIESRELPLNKGEEFENEVAEVIKKIAFQKGIAADRVYQTGAQTFPDIVVDGYGIEVKFSKSTKWESTGNSTFESTYAKDVDQEIFVFFGQKKGDFIEVKHKKYGDCLSEIKITHKPRFMISMNLEDGESVLSKMQITYEEYRVLDKKVKEQKVRSYLSNGLVQGESIVEIDEEATVSARIKNFKNFDSKTKKKIRVELYVLFPSLISNNNSKYKDLPAYLIKKYNAFAPSLRDLFSAGGKYSLNFRDILVENCPRKYVHIYENSKNIEHILLNISEDELYNYWSKIDEINITLREIQSSKIETWKRLINYFGDYHEGYSPFDFYENGYHSSILDIEYP